MLAGGPKVGKSWMALDIGLAVASGEPALGAVEVSAGPVLYLALEDGSSALAKPVEDAARRRYAAGAASFRNGLASARTRGARDPLCNYRRPPGRDSSSSTCSPAVRPHVARNANLYSADYDLMASLKRTRRRTLRCSVGCSPHAEGQRSRFPGLSLRHAGRRGRS